MHLCARVTATRLFGTRLKMYEWGEDALYGATLYLRIDGVHYKLPPRVLDALKSHGLAFLDKIPR